MNKGGSMTDRIFRLGFLLAGITNIVGILLITRWWTSDTLRTADPAAFSDFGVLMIIVWGLAYIGTSDFCTRAVFLPLVFAIEKLAYTINWAFWMRDHSAEIERIAPTDPLGAFFLQSYGLNDGAYGLFFLVVAVANARRSA